MISSCPFKMHIEQIGFLDSTGKSTNKVTKFYQTYSFILMTNFESLANVEWVGVPSTPYIYAPELILSKDASSRLHVARNKSDSAWSSPLAIKFYPQNEKPNSIVLQLIGQRLQNVVEFHEVQFEKPSFLVMQLCGKNLKSLQNQQNQRRSEETTLNIAEQILNGLRELKMNRIIHGDIKPQNVVVSKKGVFKLCDIDYSMRQTEAQRKKIRVGTFEYMAPEILLDGTCSYQSDIWSFGLLLYELHFGAFPWQRPLLMQGFTEDAFLNYHRTIKSDLPKLREQLNSLKKNSATKQTAFVLELILSCLNFEPSERKSLEELSLLASKIKKKISSNLSSNFKNQPESQGHQHNKTTLFSILSNLSKDLEVLPSNDLLQKKAKLLASNLQRVLDLLKEDKDVKIANLKQYTWKIITESTKLSEIMRGNVKRLGNQAKIVYSPKKMQLVDHLQEATEYLQKLSFDEQSRHPQPTSKSVEYAPL